jgi:hypothetical protein
VRREAIRRRIAIALVICIAAISYFVVYRFLTVQETSGPDSHSLVISFIGFTNRFDAGRDAILSVSNRGRQSVWLNNYLSVHYFDSVRSSDFHELTNAAELRPKTAQICFIPAPTNEIRWRAEIGGVNQHEINFKQKLKRTPLFNDYPFVLHPRYSQTEWIAP